jgi:hypothetical protein
MTESSKSALVFLQDLRKERDELNVIIQALEKRLGIVPGKTEGETASSESPRVTVSLESIPVGFFHNLSQAAAAEKLLMMNPGHPLTTNEILDAFRKSGMHANGKNAVTILYTALKRSPKFERVAGKAWGMSEWYPQKKRQKDEPALALDDDHQVAH